MESATFAPTTNLYPKVEKQYTQEKELEYPNVAPAFTDRMERVWARLKADFGFEIACESQKQPKRLGINLFKLVSVYPVLVIHLVDRKMPLWGKTSHTLETVYKVTDKIGNHALVTSLALAIIALISSSEVIATATAITFTAAFITKGVAFLSTLSADFFNEWPKGAYNY